METRTKDTKDAVSALEQQCSMNPRTALYKVVTHNHKVHKKMRVVNEGWVVDESLTTGQLMNRYGGSPN